MNNEAERLARAGNYVLGMMDAAERERAEHDLVVDAAFRDAVVSVAERMHMFDVPGSDGTSDSWETVAARLAELPQMRALAARETPKAVRAGVKAPQLVGQPLHATGGRRGLIVAIALIVVFALGYAAGRFTVEPATVVEPAPR